MNDNKVNDEVRDKIIKAVKQVVDAKNNGECHPLLIDGDLDEAKRMAEELYKKTKDPSALEIIGVTYAEIDKIRRSRGRPQKLLYKPKQIVQLVYKQSYQANVAFTNRAGKDKNECFSIVAENLNVGVDQIVKQYEKVPESERKKIKEWLKKTLEKHGKLKKR